MANIEDNLSKFDNKNRLNQPEMDKDNQSMESKHGTNTTTIG